jgi:hypothetical protein
MALGASRSRGRTSRRTGRLDAFVHELDELSVEPVVDPALTCAASMVMRGFLRLSGALREDRAQQVAQTTDPAVTTWRVQ